MTAKERLLRGETLVGCFQRIPAAEVTELAAFAGFDFVVCDMEHGPLSVGDVAGLVRAAEATGIAPFVRVPGPDPVTIARVLETGAAGIHVPQLESAAEAEAVVRATRHHPRGDRGLAAPRGAGYGARMSLAEYVRRSEESLLVVVHVESRAALAQAGEIAAVDGVDVVFIGLTDLSQDAGVPGEYDHPDVRGPAEAAIRAIRERGKAAGMPVRDAEMARDYAGLGATYLTPNDVRLLLAGSRELLAAVRRGS